MGSISAQRHSSSGVDKGVTAERVVRALFGARLQRVSRLAFHGSNCLRGRMTLYCISVANVNFLSCGSFGVMPIPNSQRSGRPCGNLGLPEGGGEPAAKITSKYSLVFSPDSPRLAVPRGGVCLRAREYITSLCWLYFL